MCNTIKNDTFVEFIEAVIEGLIQNKIENITEVSAVVKYILILEKTPKTARCKLC